MLRPLWWLKKQHAEVGGSVEINVPECGIEGQAAVLNIEPCPPIKPRPGLRVVTGVFKHRASQVLDVYVEGIDEPIGTTPNHPFWSEDRRAFVRADELKEGEHLRAFNGTPIVRRVVPLADPEPVFNLEVQCDHVYHVAKNGVLVHNGNGVPCELAELVTRANSSGQRITVIGRMDDVGKYTDDIFDGWHKTAPEGPFSLKQNRDWLKERVERGDLIVLVSDRARISNQYIPNVANGFYTSQELRWLDKWNVVVEALR